MPLDVPKEASRRVLVVDDEPVVCDVLSRVLASEGLTVDTALSAEDALAKLKTERYALLVSDKNLPKMSGLQLVALARREQPFMEAVVITAFASAEALLWAFAAGASDFITKPFPDLRVVRAKLKAAVERFVRRANGAAERSVAREAAELIMTAPQTPKPALSILQSALLRYEEAVSTPKGRVAVDDPSTAFAAAISSAGIELTDRLNDADLVLVDAMRPDWRDRVRALRLTASSPTVIVVAEPAMRLDELLEALELQADVAPSPSADAHALNDRVRALLSERGVERAQAELAATLERVRLAAA